ncbi:hypothetical protein BDP81DRAFT_432203 [Colletotrichum phormii]|uniref:Uncharacterized protein n=1 Tax=Colletotrichum phormii TaxID=359342 RepID=A0AAJ0EFE6_9PEZI|nr:uncharacterized protein BDP81DRAFT_432203 [Colletotrichum phormii]KAK1634900.1 hypothetical protein BDP81DRAFT_432203 [Colletotrichum phormii]
MQSAGGSAGKRSRAQLERVCLQVDLRPPHPVRRDLKFLSKHRLKLWWCIVHLVARLPMPKD